MKHLLPILFLALTAWSCQSNDNASNNTETNDEMLHEDHDMDSHSDDHDAMHATSLELNDGNKWKTDVPTKKNADHMESVTAQFQKSNPSSLADFKKYGSDIQAGLNQMISECTMTGAQDQALHQWFFPIMENAGEIKKTDNTEKAKHLSHEIIERVEVFEQYFE